MFAIIKILTSFTNIIGDVTDLKNPSGVIDPMKVEKLLDDVIADAEVAVPKDSVLFEKIRTAIDAAIEAIVEEQKNPI